MLPEQEQKDVTLRAFVSPNDKLLTAISVLGGLTLLFSVIDKGAAFYFVSLFIFVVLARELNSRFPNWRTNTIELFLFRILFLSVLWRNPFELRLFFHFRVSSLLSLFGMRVCFCKIDFAQNQKFRSTTTAN